VNEKQWLGAAAPDGGLDYLCSEELPDGAGLSANRRKAGRRKLRLFLCACVRRVWELIPAGPYRAAVALGERLADGEDVAEQIAALPKEWVQSGPLSRRHAASATGFCVGTDIRVMAAFGTQAAARAAGWVREEIEVSENVQSYDRGKCAEERAQVALLSDVFGNPFRPMAVDREWLTSTVQMLAQGVYDERAFDRLPILADALEEAGCTHVEMLSHCRQPGEHVRGCWVVDLLLGNGLSRRGR
jgi:hypothetical protein